MTNERCPICYVMSLQTHTDENERSHGHCTECGFNTDADGTENRDTPLGEQIDGGNDHVADEVAGDNWHAMHDDDPNPYAGTYSEE